MTLGSVFGGSLSVNLNNAKQEILGTLKQRSKNKNFAQLEQDLNDYFYKQNDGNAAQEINSIQKQVENSLLENANEILNSINFDSVDVKEIKTDEQYMLTQTLRTVIIDLKKKIHQLQIGLNRNERSGIDVSAARKELDSLRNTVDNAVGLLKRANTTLGGDVNHRISGRPLSNAKKYYNLLYAYNKALEQNISSMKAIGDVFEQGIAKFASNREKWVDGITNSLIDEATTRITGGNVMGRGGGLIELVEMRMDNKHSSNETFNLVETSKSGDITMTTTYDTGSARQIKMDVELNIKGNNYGSDMQSFRISAKNWSRTGASGSLGETNLLSALSRSSNKQRQFSMGMLSNYADEAAFELGRLSIMADIAAGLSQESGYADTLVINTGSKIRVIDIGSAIEAAMEAGFNSGRGVTLYGYHYEALKQTARQTLFNGLRGKKSPGRTKLYLQLYYGYLQQVKVSMSINTNAII